MGQTAGCRAVGREESSCVRSGPSRRGLRTEDGTRSQPEWCWNALYGRASSTGWSWGLDGASPSCGVGRTEANGRCHSGRSLQIPRYLTRLRLGLGRLFWSLSSTSGPSSWAASCHFQHTLSLQVSDRGVMQIQSLS